MPSEADFQKWYAGHAKKLGLAPNPDDPQHFYDYRAAYRAGAKPDASGHWPSAYKRVGHPRLVIGGVDTRTGQPVMPRKYDTDTKKNVLSYYTRALKRKGLKPLTEEEKRERERKRKRAEVDAFMSKGRRQTSTRKPPTPKTPEQIRSEAAAGRRESVELPPLGALREALTPKKKKKD